MTKQDVMNGESDKEVKSVSQQLFSVWENRIWPAWLTLVKVDANGSSDWRDPTRSFVWLGLRGTKQETGRVSGGIVATVSERNKRHTSAKNKFYCGDYPPWSPWR